MSSVGGSQGWLLPGVSPLAPLPGNIWGGQKPADMGVGFSLDTDASNVPGGDNKTAATNQSIASAAELASEDVASLASVAKQLGDNPHHISMWTCNLDQNGNVVAGAELDANGDLNVYGSGSSDGATAQIRMLIPGPKSGSEDWATAAANELAQAAYKLNTVLDSVTGNASGTNVNASA